MYPEGILVKHVNAMQTGICQTLGDANPNAREHGKMAFCWFNEKFPTEGRRLLNSLDAVTRKHLENFMPKN